MSSDPQTNSDDSKQQQQPFAPGTYPILTGDQVHYQQPGSVPVYGVPMYGFAPPSPQQQPFYQEGHVPVYGQNTFQEMNNMGFSKFHDASGPMKEELLEELPPVSFQGTELNAANFQEVILNQDYQINIRKIFGLSWAVYKQHWVAFVFFTVFQILLNFVPYIGHFVAFPLSVGILIAVCNKIRGGNIEAELKYDHLFYGFLFYIPLILIGIFSAIVYVVGLFLCIIPGIYAMFVLAFSIPIFLEYHIFDVGVIGAMILSQRVVNKHFIDVAAFLLLNFVFVLFGILCFGLPGLITIPMGQINIVFAFREMFGLYALKVQEKRCVIC